MCELYRGGRFFLYRGQLVTSLCTKHFLCVVLCIAYVSLVSDAQVAPALHGQLQSQPIGPLYRSSCAQRKRYRKYPVFFVDSYNSRPATVMCTTRITERATLKRKIDDYRLRSLMCSTNVHEQIWMYSAPRSGRLTFDNGVIDAPVKEYASGRRRTTVDLVSLDVNPTEEYQRVRSKVEPAENVSIEDTV